MKRFWFIMLLSPVFSEGQIITTVAGGGTSLADGIVATSASLSTVAFASFDVMGNFYFAEALGNERVRMLDNSGIIHRVAGNGTTGFSGDGGPATNAQLHQLNATIVDPAGNIYISDYGNFRVRKVDVSTNIIHTIAGTGANASSGDGGPATAAEIVPGGLALDITGNLYVIDIGSATIRKINTAGIITRIAGNGTVGYAGDGGPATAASLRPDISLCYSKTGDLYFGCVNRIRKVNLITGIITTFAGNGVGGYNGEGVYADSAGFTCPFAICIDTTGQLYIADYSNQRVRVINTAHLIYTVAGTGTAGFSGDGGPATTAKIYWPEGLTTDACGNLFIADMVNKRIRKVAFNPMCNPSLLVEDANTGQDLRIYPIPATAELNIMAHYTISIIAITDLIGRAIYTQKFNSKLVQIDIADLSTGVYFIRINGTEVRRFVKE